MFKLRIDMNDTQTFNTFLEHFKCEKRIPERLDTKNKDHCYYKHVWEIFEDVVSETFGERFVVLPGHQVANKVVIAVEMDIYRVRLIHVFESSKK